ncbi:hypothetical protein FQA39_LY05162 [Lamprigera yunnana]|nr:hypothetical protein FQA39_LY05162 [Lamprigera yunnana]
MTNEFFEWIRPENAPYPHVWRRFKGRQEINGTVPIFWIQDIPVDQFETAMDFAFGPFSQEEPLCKFSGRIMCDLDEEMLFSSEFSDVYQPSEGEKNTFSEDDANSSRIRVQKKRRVSNQYQSSLAEKREEWTRST